MEETFRDCVGEMERKIIQENHERKRKYCAHIRKRNVYVAWACRKNWRTLIENTADNCTSSKKHGEGRQNIVVTNNLKVLEKKKTEME